MKIIFLITAILISGCIAPTSAQNLTETFVFIDASKSSKPLSNAVRKADAGRVYGALTPNVRNDGDKVHVSYLYELTINVSNCKTAVFSKPKLQIPERTQPQLIQGIKDKHAKKVRLEAKTLCQKVCDKIISAPSDSEHSAILASLEVVRKISGNGTNIKLIYASDMLEDSRFIDLTSYLNGNASPSQVRAKGQEIATALSVYYGFNSTDFGRVESVAIVLPYTILEQRKTYENLRYFYEGFFTELGLPTPNFLQ